MRRLVTGIDGHGGSCVISDREIEFSGAARDGAEAELFLSEEHPSAPAPPGSSNKVEVDLGRRTSWVAYRWGPNGETPMHYTDTIDVGVVLYGNIEIVLGDGAHQLEAGDCIVVTGIDHAWNAGPDGCVMCVASIGTPRA